MCAGRKERGKGEREGERQAEREEGRSKGGREEGTRKRREGKEEGSICHLVGGDFDRSNTLKQATMSLLLGLGAVRILHSY